VRWPHVRPAEIAFAAVGLPLAIACGLYVAAVLYLGGLLTLTIVGLPLVIGGLRVIRGLGTLHRVLAERLLGEHVATPPPPSTPRNPFGWVRAGLGDAVAWRTVLYLLVRVPVALLTFLAGAFSWFYGAFLLGLPLLSPVFMGNELSWWLVVTASATGLVLLGAAPWATGATADLNRWLVRTLLAGEPASPRLQRLERARSEVAADAAATLRRIERDLHDGTQARLVTIALSLAMMDEALEAGKTDRARVLVQRTRNQLSDAITELRQLTRGINPVALDGGLADALPTLAADAGIPTEVHVELPERPGPAIERIVYFCVAELITNAAKHSGADSVRVDVTAEGDQLCLQVSDDGRGGARLGIGSGLRGLRDRLDTVDGTLSISSPAGGPTVIAARVPVRL
jgi:signal transduction histidine kinase